MQHRLQYVSVVGTYPIRPKTTSVKATHVRTKVAPYGHIEEGGHGILARLQQVDDVAGERECSLGGVSSKRQEVR